jgi:hypothetical protein
MRRLRHPIRAIREPFGTAGLIVAMIALVAALGGTALAAKGALTGKQKKEVEKIAKKYAGKPGAPGANGTNGSPGAKGDTGAPGANGTNGTNGSPGTNGKSVAIGATAPGCGAPGGHTIEVAGEPSTKQNVCNGTEGSPWTELGTLPEEQAETGAWGFSPLPKTLGLFLMKLPISFPIPLESALPETAVHVVGIGQTGPTECEEGTAEAPAAAPGNLCVYIQFGENPNHLSEELEAGDLLISSPETGELGTAKAGAILTSPGLPEGAYGSGTWVVRAP